MNRLSMRKSLRAMSVVFVASLAFAAQGAPNVFDDAVFWFRGGKDKNGDGCMQQGEFFDDLHADDSDHNNHKMSMANYMVDSNSRAFKGNAALVQEQVVFPALGKSVVKDVNVLRLSNKNVKNPNDGKNYFWPEYVNPGCVFTDNNITREFTIISRMRLDDDGMTRTQCVFKIGYKASSNQGMWLAVSELQESTKTKYLTGRCTSAESGSDESFSFPGMQIPTNTWFDLAVVVGNGNRLRIGIALPETSGIHGNNHTIAFAEFPMLTVNPLSTGDDYRFFCYEGQDTYQLQANADLTCFRGSVQQIAIWGRALNDQEVMAAFGMPRPAIFRTGFDNAASNEFGGERTGPTQTIDGLGSWQNIANTMQAGDIWTVNFKALRDEANLPQIFSMKSLRGSAAQIEPKLNGTSLGEGRVASNQRFFWPVAANLVREGANELVIERKDGWTGTFKLDAMELGGALGVGSASDTYDDGRVFPELIATGVPSAADPNLAHWPVGFRPFLNNNTNLHFRVWVDPDVVGVCTSRFWTRVQCKKRTSSSTVTGQEKFTIFVNGEAKTTFNANGSWKDVDPITFDPGVLRGGWNDFEIRSNEAYTTLYWVFDRYRFETVLPSAFGFPPPLGMSVIIK